MSEVDKLYSLAGVEKHKTHHKDYEDWFWVYPPFTAEKQIELIKWLAPRYLDLSKYHDVATNKDMYGIRTDVGTYAYCHREKFEEMLAGLIIDLWQNLTEAEQNEIREILK